MIDAATTLALAILAAAAGLCIVRLVRPGSLADRIVALDSLLVITVCGVAVAAARERGAAFLDVAIVASLLGFIGSASVARFIERRGA